MPDTYPPEVRREVMRRVKRRDTGPEMKLRRGLFAQGVRGWRCDRKDLPGRPDLAFGPRRLAVFVDGAFWHGHPSKYWQGRTSKYWDDKITKNVARDERVNRELASSGWRVLRIWDFEINKDPDVAVARVVASLDASASPVPSPALGEKGIATPSDLKPR